jgi:DNA-binding response OmpR family regulator
MDVLLVEDEPLVRELLSEALHEAGLEVAEAPDAETALGAAPPREDAPGPPVVVVTDVDLGPGINGVALAAEARRRWPGVGVVYITGRQSNLNGHALGARDRFLPKPFVPDALVRTVRALMGPCGVPRPSAMRGG